MTILNNDQLNTLDKDAMALIIKTLQSQLMLLESTNKKLMSQLETSEATTKKLLAQIDALTAQIRLSNQRVFGRKNYLFCESVNSVNASAVIYSIIETAKANNLHVHRYLEFLITELSKRRKAGTLDHIDDLLPWAKIPQKECKAPIKNS